MKTTVYEFRQVVLGLSFFHSFEEKEYSGREQIYNEDGSGTKVVRTSKEDMTPFEKMMFEEYEENEFDYQPTLTGNLF